MTVEAPIKPEVTAEVKPDLEPQKTITGADAPKEEKSLLDQPEKTEEPNPGSEPAKPEDKKEPVIPETYAEPTLPQGFVIDPELKKELDVQAKGLKLTQEQYNDFVNLGVKSINKHADNIMSEFNKQIDGWKKESIGALGADYEKELGFARKGIDKVFTDQKEATAFKERMSESGLGNWLPMIKVLTFIGKTLAEDKIVTGKSDANVEKSAAEVMYPSMKPK